MKKRILIVEDNAEFRKIYGDRLSFSGFEVLAAEDGVEGLKKAQAEPFDLVITDLNMPNLDGYGLIEAMKKDDTLKNIPIIVMSVFDTIEHLDRARALGVTDYLVKGVTTPNEVVKKVEAALGITS